MANRIDDIRKKMFTDNYDLEYWLQIRKEVNEILRNPTEEEYLDWKNDWGLGEMLEMTIINIRYDIEHGLADK